MVASQQVHGPRHHDCRSELRRLFRQLPGAVWVTDRDLHIVEFIGDVEANLGIPHARIPGMSVADIARTREPSDPATAAHLGALEGRSSTFRYHLREHWYEVHVEPLRDRDGDTAGTIGAAVEITSRVEAEQRAVASELRLSELQGRSISLLEATIESTADGILVVDRDNRVVAYNSRFLSLWNIPADIASRRDDSAMINYVLDQLVDPEQFLTRVRELYATPGAEDLDTLEFKDGRVFERYSRPQTIAGDIVGRVWSFRDVTTRERMLRDAVLLADASRLLATLDATAALDGVSRLLARTHWDACAIDLFDGAGPRTLVASARDGTYDEIPLPMPSERSVVQAHGNRRLLVTPLLVGGEVAGAISVLGAPHVNDQRDLEVLEEIARRCAVALANARLYQLAQESIRAREEFLAVASHEIRGPVAAIRLAVDTLRTGGTMSTKALDIIDREEHRLERLVNQLLDVGRIQSGQMQLVIEPVDLAALVREVAARLAPDVERNRSTLVVHGPVSLPGRWDRTRLDQVITNLIGNAIKFGAGKPIEVRMTTDRDQVRLEVEDHGVGIPPDKLASIFNPFERAVPARHYGGLGLGLYIVRTIVTRLGGTVDVRSTVAEGTTFTVTLPRTGGT